MTYDEAIQALNAGKRIRRRVWNDESYWYRTDRGIRMSLGGIGGHYCYPHEIEKLADDWQVLD